MADYFSELIRLIAWRIIILLLYVFGDIFIPDHNASGVEVLQDLFATPFSQLILKPFTRWDSVYYITIALRGYQKEHYYVFYPFYPFLLRYMGMFIQFSGMPALESVILGGILLNTLCYILNYYLLKQILQKLHYSQAIQDTAGLLYLYQPATVFSLTIYTEAVYTTFTWIGIYSYLHPDRRIQCFGIGCFGLASLTRSNGVLNILFLLTVSLRRLLATHSTLTKTAEQYPEGVLLLLGVIACCVPSYVIQCMLYPLLCHSHNHTFSLTTEMTKQALCTVQTPPTTPTTASFFLAGLWQPSVYSYLQSVYWQIGWFRSYSLRQIPNFLLALPVSLIIGYYGLVRSFVSFSRRKERMIDYLLAHPESVWIAQSSLVLLLLFTVAHVQIATRLFATSPYLYLLLAQEITQDTQDTKSEQSEQSGKKAEYLWRGWMAYAAVGLVLHGNHFPWT